MIAVTVYVLKKNYDMLCLFADINECSPNNPCPNGGNCTNTIGSYICNCTSGWSGANCTTGKKHNPNFVHKYKAFVGPAKHISTYSWSS